MHLTRTGAAAVLSVAILAVVEPARADDDYLDQKDATGHSVVFKDDPMTAAGRDASGYVLTVRPGAARVGLLKPRVHFIVEMLKSIESL